MKLEKIPGEDEAWAKLATLDPAEVCRRAMAHFNEQTETYPLK
jgi:hypothetical protein